MGSTQEEELDEASQGSEPKSNDDDSASNTGCSEPESEKADLEPIFGLALLSPRIIQQQVAEMEAAVDAGEPLSSQDEIEESPDSCTPSQEYPPASPTCGWPATNDDAKPKGGSTLAVVSSDQEVRERLVAKVTAELALERAKSRDLEKQIESLKRTRDELERSVAALAPPSPQESEEQEDVSAPPSQQPLLAGASKPDETVIVLDSPPASQPGAGDGLLPTPNILPIKGAPAKRGRTGGARNRRSRGVLQPGSCHTHRQATLSELTQCSRQPGFVMTAPGSGQPTSSLSSQRNHLQLAVPMPGLSASPATGPPSSYLSQFRVRDK
jgi:hypothetical protein